MRGPVAVLRDAHFVGSAGRGSINARASHGIPHIRRTHASSPQVKPKITSAESASDQWMPIRLPIEADRRRR